MFEVIGERINTSRKLVQAAVADRNAQYIIDDVTKQQEAGAAFIDVNAQAHDQFCMNYLKTVRSGAIES
jgi:5-methyltetrahydrofolate--homocysteine methyltransferase